MLLETFLFPLGIILLAVGGDRLVLGAKGLSSKLQVPPFIIGIFILGFGTSLPELFVTIRALENGNPDIAIGGILGSNIANIGLVLGITAIVGSISVSKTFYQLNWPSMMLFSIVLYLVK